MARWWCRTVRLRCPVPAPRTCGNGRTPSGRSSGRLGRKALDNGAAKGHDDVLDLPVQSSGTAFPKRHFPAIHLRRDDAMSSHLPVTIMREPDLVMSVRRMLTSLVVSVLVCGVSNLAQAQNPSSTASKDAAKPAPAKPEAKPAAAVAG